MIDPRYADLLREYRSNPQGIRRKNMNIYEYEELKRSEREAAVAAACAEATQRAREEDAAALLSKGVSEEIVSECLKLPIEEVRKLAKRC